MARGDDFRVATSTANHEHVPSVAMDADGAFVVAWMTGDQYFSTGGDIYARRFQASGIAQDDEFRVNTTTTGIPSSVGMAAGSFVIAWRSNEDTGYHIYARRYGNGAAASKVFLPLIEQ